MNKIVITIFITGIFIVITLLYAFGIITPMVQERIPTIFIILALIIFTSIILALLATMLKRLKEIKEVDKDDISKY